MTTDPGLGAGDAVSEQPEPKPWAMVTPPQPTRADVQAGRISQAHFLAEHGYPWDAIGRTPTEAEEIVLIREWETEKEIERKWWEEYNRKRNEGSTQTNPFNSSNESPSGAIRKPWFMLIPPKPTRADVQAGLRSPSEFFIGHGYPWNAVDRTPTEEETIVLVNEWEEKCEEERNRKKYEDFLRRNPSLATGHPSGADENTPADQNAKSRTLSEESRSKQMIPMAGCMETPPGTTPVQHCPSPGDRTALPLSTPGGQTSMGECTAGTSGTQSNKRKRSLSLGSQEGGVNTPLSSVAEQQSDLSTPAKKRKM